MSISLNDKAFETASEKLKSVAQQMKDLREDMHEELKKLQNGFQTAAGTRFFNACDDNLIEYMKMQEDIIQHISNNLEAAKTAYEPVFTGYEELNTRINKQLK